MPPAETGALLTRHSARTCWSIGQGLIEDLCGRCGRSFSLLVMASSSAPVATPNQRRPVTAFPIYRHLVFRAIVATCGASWLLVAGAHAQSDFYRAAEQELAGRPGTLIRQEPMPGAPLQADAYRVLYRSTGLKGEPIAVSGIVIIPPG